MSGIIVASSTALAVAVFIAARAVLGARRRVITGRLEQITGSHAVHAGSGVRERVLRPMLLPIVGRAHPLVDAEPAALRRSLQAYIEAQLLAAGQPLGARPFMLVALLVPLLAATLAAAAAWREGGVGFVLLAAGIGAAAPFVWLSGAVTRRRERINQQLPDVLDLVVVSAEAGLSFEASIARISEHAEGPLPAEFQRVLAEINVGLGRRRALQGMASRTRVAAVGSLVSAILQAEQTGMSISIVLRAQAEHLRTVRRQTAEQTAMKAPLKMLFPLVFLILPALFVVVLGPALLQLLHAMRASD